MGHFFYSLSTGKRINRSRWTKLPMPDDVVRRIHQLACRDGMVKGRLVFESRYPDDTDELGFFPQAQLGVADDPSLADDQDSTSCETEKESDNESKSDSSDGSTSSSNSDDDDHDQAGDACGWNFSDGNLDGDHLNEDQGVPDQNQEVEPVGRDQGVA
jgi:hypothetical protein